MIIAILGGIGSGKTLTAVKMIKDNNSLAVTNFNLINIPNYIRIREKDIITKKDGKKTSEWGINWGYWDRLRKSNPVFSIYLDEIHNLIHSRASMTKRNILLSKWVSQIRKILSDSEFQHLYIISQTLRKIDIDFRELAQVFITCQKFRIGKQVYIKNRYYGENYSYDDYSKPLFSHAFCANPYFKHFDTNEMVKFGDAEEFI